MQPAEGLGSSPAEDYGTDGLWIDGAAAMPGR
jgi:hypothetical protein